MTKKIDKEENTGNDLKRQIELFCIDRGLNKDEVLSAIEKAIAGAYRKEFGDKDYAYDANYDLETGKYNVFRVQRVVEEETESPEKEISIMEARLNDPTVSIGDELREEVSIDQEVDFGRIASQVAKQVLVYTINNMKHTKVLSKFKDRIGELVSVEIDGFRKGGYIVKLANTTGFISKENILPVDRFKPGTIVKALIVDITEDPQRGSRIILSRTDNEFVHAIIKQEVPEVEAGVVTVDKIAREAGIRSKILVSVSEDEDNGSIDPVGTILGRKNIRIINIIREISVGQQEKVDIVENQPGDLENMIADALEPAEIEKIELGKNKEGKKTAKVYCYPEEAALAVGRKGVNVRLASKLLDIIISIETMSEEQMEENSPKLIIDDFEDEE